jgi:hypothetical protein
MKFFLVLMTFAAAAAWSALDDEDYPYYRLAEERMNTHQQMAENPFDFRVDWPHAIWPRHVVHKLAKETTIRGGKIEWITDAHELGGKNRRPTPERDMFRITIDVAEWKKFSKSPYGGESVTRPSDSTPLDPFCSDADKITHSNATMDLSCKCCDLSNGIPPGCAKGDHVK